MALLKIQVENNKPGKLVNFTLDFKKTRLFYYIYYLGINIFFYIFFMLTLKINIYLCVYFIFFMFNEQVADFSAGASI